MRWLLLGLAVAVAGCGKSFQEANAIYEDEVKKLEALEADRAHKRDEVIRAFSTAKDIIAIEEQRLRNLVEYDGSEADIEELKRSIKKDRQKLEAQSEEEELSAIDAKDGPLIEAQRAIVDQAEKAKESAK